MATDYQSYLITAISELRNFEKPLHLERVCLKKRILHCYSLKSGDPFTFFNGQAPFLSQGSPKQDYCGNKVPGNLQNWPRHHQEKKKSKPQKPELANNLKSLTHFNQSYFFYTIYC